MSNLRKDPIWDELRYWLAHPVTEEEKSAREKQEAKFWDDKLEAATNKRYEEKYGQKYGKQSKSKGVATGGAAPLTGGVVMYQDPYESILSDPNLSKQEKVAKIQEVAATRNKEIEAEHKKKMAKIALGGALEIGSAFIPGGGALGAKVAGKIAAPLVSSVGRKIAKTIGENAVRGGITGAVEGLGRGMVENKNPIKTAVQDGVTGIVSGGALGAAGGQVQKIIRGKKLKSYGDVDNLNMTARKQYNKDAVSYYQDYVQKTANNQNGQVNFSGCGIQEQLHWNPNQAKHLPELRADFKKAKRLPDEPNLDPDKKFTEAFEVYRGKSGDHLVERFKDKSRRYYMTRSTSNGTSRTASPDSMGNASSSIIPQSASKLKPLDEWLRIWKQIRNK